MSSVDPGFWGLGHGDQTPGSYIGCINKMRHMIVKVIVREVLERELGLVTKFNEVETYTLEMEPRDVFSTFEEARQVWGEYDVMFEGLGDDKFTLVKPKTYKEEMDDRQWLQDLHDETAYMDFE
jgi:hypothetical protein